ncbi:MAG: twin-arginine translocase TatA/TatE family subunit [Oscillospiraceae bacterium]|nr:twin-arginine translocase TatA/TatE family subunit [Oscillospiraceae bacterium]
MFGKIGVGELLLILGIVLIVFGPAKLPALAKSIGQAFNEFRKGAKGIAKEFDEDLKEETSETKAEDK